MHTRAKTKWGEGKLEDFNLEIQREFWKRGMQKEEIL